MQATLYFICQSLIPEAAPVRPREPPRDNGRAAQGVAQAGVGVEVLVVEFNACFEVVAGQYHRREAQSPSRASL